MTCDLRCSMVFLCLLGACSDGGAPAPTIEGPPLPGMTITGNSDAPWVRLHYMAPSCLTRYDFEDGPDVECRTEFVNGDPLHWIRTCPDHRGLRGSGIGLEVEQRVTEDGDPLFRHWVGIGNSGITRYTYDDEGRLSLIEFDDDSDGDIDATKTITEHDADGRPLAATIDGPLIDSPGDEFPAREEHETWGYDEHGRLISIQRVLVVDGTVTERLSISYDDQARRRNWDLIIDNGPGYQPHPYFVEGYELFDEENRLVTHNWVPDGSEIGWIFQYRYDDEDRLLTTIADLSADSDQDRLRYVAHEVHDCP